MIFKKRLMQNASASLKVLNFFRFFLRIQLRLFIALSHLRDACNDIAFLKINQLHTRSNAAKHRDSGTSHTDHDAFRIDDHNLVVVIDSLNTDYIAGLLGDLITLDPLAASVLASEFSYRGTFPHTPL